MAWHAVELGTSAATGFAGRLFNDLGMPVTRLAGPSGPRDPDSRVADFLHTGKRIRPLVREALAADLTGADIVITDSWVLDELRLTVGELHQLAPRAVVAVADLPELPDAVRSDAALNAVLEAQSGLLLLRTAEDGTPLVHRSLALVYAAGLLLTTAAMSAWIASRRDAQGQCVVARAIDAALLLVEGVWVAYPHLGVSPSGRWTRTSQLRVLPCADGYIAPIFRGQDGWERLCLGLLDRPDLVDDPRFVTLDARANNMPALRAELAPWFAIRTRDQIFSTALELQLPFGKFMRLEEQVRDPQNHHRQFFVDGDPPGRRALRLPFTWQQGQRAAPAMATGRAGDPPLRGMRVVEMGMYWAGPLAARILAELGADVIKLESPRNFDPSRYSNIADSIAGPDPWERGWTTMTAAGKRSVVLDLNAPDGRTAFRKVLARCDLLIANTSTRVLPNLGLDPRLLCEDFPRLSVIQMSGYGADGPYANFPAFGVALEAISGLAFLTDNPSGEPITVASTLSDPIAGLFAALAAIARYAGLGRAKNGFIDLSERESALWMAGDLLVSDNHAPARGKVIAQPVAGRDGWLLALTDAHQRRRDGATRPIPPQSDTEIAASVSASGGVAVAVRTAEAVAHAPDLLGRSLIPVKQPVIGWRLVPSTGIQFERARTVTGRPSHRFGADTRDVLDEAGLSATEIDRFFADGVASVRPNPAPAVQMIDVASLERTGAVTRRDPNYRRYLEALGGGAEPYGPEQPAEPHRGPPASDPPR
ncbi:MAG: CoA transferase [Dehalococcoidia bacterium]